MVVAMRWRCWIAFAVLFQLVIGRRFVNTDDMFSGAPVAVAITVLKDPSYDKIPADKNLAPAGFIDGAAILAQSVRDTMSKDYPVDMIALVHPKVKAARQLLRDAGYRLIEFQFPLKSSEIQGEELRNTIGKSGCCGIDELGKLGAYTLTQYQKVLLMDSDALLLQNIDELWAADREAQYTYDHGLGGGCMNGGFFMIKPSMETFRDLVETARVGDFRGGEGWGGSKIGWCWGGQTVQGLVPYYYQKSGKKDASAWLALDSSIYNNMVASHNDQGQAQKEVPLEQIKTTHYTWCQKPWGCRPKAVVLCKQLHDQWWLTRERFEKQQGLKQGSRCAAGEYQGIDYASREKGEPV